MTVTRTKLKVVPPDDDSFFHEDDKEELGQDKQEVDITLEYDSPQFFYLGRLMNKKHFRAFVYGKDGQILANSYVEYEKLIATGIWFDSKESYEKSLVQPEIPAKKTRKKRTPKEVQLDIQNKKEFSDVDESQHEVIEYGANR